MKTKLRILTIALALIAAVILARPASAQTVKSADNIVISKNEVISSSLVATGSTINVEGTIDGDLYCLGSNVIISGRVNGDVLCTAQSINLSGQITGSARLLASDINISGTSSASVLLVGQNAIITDKAKIAQDATVLSTNSKINGLIARDLTIYSQASEVGANLGRNLSANVMNLTLAPSANIIGNLSYTSNNNLIQRSGSKVSGSITHNQAMQANPRNANIAVMLFGLLIFVASLLIVSLLTMWAVPTFIKSTHDEIKSSVGKTALYGLANIFIVPVVALLIFVTFVGAPLAGLIVVAWLLSLILCGPVFAYYIGRKILGKSPKAKNDYIVMLVGSLVILGLYLIPVVNFITGCIVGIVGSGAIMAHFKHLNARTAKRPSR